MPTFQPLTQDQVNFFHTFGYLHLPGWFRDEIGTLAEAFDRAFKTHEHDVIRWEHEAHYNRIRMMLPNLPDRDPALHGLLASPRLQDVATKLAGNNFNYVPSEGNIFSGDTIWHSDEYNPFIQMPENHTYFKIALYLDPMTTNQGGFRIIPGSHHLGGFYQMLQTHLKDNTQAYGLTPEKIPCIILESQPGDIIVFNYRTQHATCGTTHPRRMLYFGITSEFTGNHQRHGVKIARSLNKAFGKVYAEPLSSTQNPTLRSCTKQIRIPPSNEKQNPC